MRDVPILGQGNAKTQLGEEWFEAECEGEDCDRRWSATGTIASRQALARAQKHSDRTGHRVSAQHANRR